MPWSAGYINDYGTDCKSKENVVGPIESIDVPIVPFLLP
jgi:hypothetical protein